MILIILFACQPRSINVNVEKQPETEFQEPSTESSDNEPSDTEETVVEPSEEEDNREEQSDEFWIEGCVDNIAAGGGEAVGLIDCSNGICEIRSGQSWVGYASGSSAECPVKQVYLSSYAIDEKEVKMGDYEQCINSGICDEIPIDCRIFINGLTGNPAYKPAICVTWHQAKSYCEYRNGRLPTEAEWERAARGDDGALYPWGSDETMFNCETANIRENDKYCNPGVSDVGFYQFIRSPYGLWDTMGNVWEWMNDSFDALYFAYGANEDPTGPVDECQLAYSMTPGPCNRKVIKGGAYNTKLWPSRASVRSFARPSVFDMNIGFRCAYDRN